MCEGSMGEIVACCGREGPLLFELGELGEEVCL
jgi:hypothetical protein